MDVDSCFRRAASFLAHASPASVLGTLFSAGPRLNELTDIVSQVDHVGFIASPVTVTSLAPAARAAGFDAGDRTFPSTILAAELGQLLGGPAVPTTVFQAWGTSAGGHPIGVEAFVPHGITEDILATWRRSGVGAHVALAVASCSDLENVSRIIEEEGCLIPPFMNGAPLVNAAEKLTVVYGDRRRNGRTVRLEFWHRG